MDVGADNFRFTLDDPEKRAVTIRQPKTSELHLDSLDRYLPSEFRSVIYSPLTLGLDVKNQVEAKVAGAIWQPSSQSSTKDCLIQTKRNLLYGYFSRIAPTQFSINYKVPTVVSGYNDILYFNTLDGANQATGGVVIPQGYYTVASLAAALQTAIRGAVFVGTPPANWTTTFTVTAPQNPISAAAPAADVLTGFTFTATTGTFAFGYPGLGNPTDQEGTAATLSRAYRLIGANRALFGFTPAISTTYQTTAPVLVASATGGPPNLKPTDYIDIVSKTLSNYKDNKDDNSSLNAPGCVLGRVWLSEAQSASSIAQGWAQSSFQGSSPISFTKSWYNPNWSQWSPNQSVSSVDITLLDQWGEPLFWSSTYNTEWSMTITASE